MKEYLTEKIVTPDIMQAAKEIVREIIQDRRYYGERVQKIKYGLTFDRFCTRHGRTHFADNIFDDPDASYFYNCTLSVDYNTDKEDTVAILYTYDVTKKTFIQVQ